MSLSTQTWSLMRVDANGGHAAINRAIAVEAPIAIEPNGMGYAVLMASPADMIDLAYGFCLAERLIDSVADILACEAHSDADGTILRLTLAPHCAERVLDRVRHRVAESACGLCGVENLAQALRPIPAITNPTEADDTAIFRAIAMLHEHQPLNRAVGATHAAALCAVDGTIRLVREDVGRHNAFDKLIGAMLRGGLRWENGFALLSSRCSYELVEKAALANCPMLVSISAPTSLALERARQCGLTLCVLARQDAILRVPAPLGRE